MNSILLVGDIILFSFFVFSLFFSLPRYLFNFHRFRMYFLLLCVFTETVHHRLDTTKEDFKKSPALVEFCVFLLRG